MISINIEAISQKTGKNLSQIAREAGINRNTIQAMALGKVNGIKFETLEKLCKTFDISIAELLHFHDRGEKKEEHRHRLYRQEGECIPFTGLPWITAVDALKTFGPLYTYFKHGYAEVFWSEEGMRRTAEARLRQYADPVAFQDAYREFEQHGVVIRHFYERAYDGVLSRFSVDRILEYFYDLRAAYQRFWLSSIFIDSFDVGVDQQHLQNTAARLGFSSHEVQTLTTPTELTFSSERKLALLKIADGIQGKRWSEEEVLHFIVSHEDIEAYKREFDSFASTYSTVKHISHQDILAEMLPYLHDHKKLSTEIDELSGYHKERKAAIARVLRAHKIKENPLWFFERLTMWREVRKKINLMGIHALDTVLSHIEIATGIPRKYLQYLSLDEVDLAFKGLVPLDELQKRREQGVMLSVQDGHFALLYGTEAESLRQEFTESIATNNTSAVIAGQTASQGYAKGIARIITDQSQFDRFNEGEILVTGMTRPEFVPLMKKAAAIVTNEGGVTCHAAIVSRELGKPCIIGTKNATSLIPDGATIEVRANHGTVRVL